MNARGMTRLLKLPPKDEVLALTAAYQASDKEHERTLLLNASGGFTVKLPSAKGSGTRLQFTVGTVSTAGYVIQCNPLTDIIQGSIYTGIDTAATGKDWQAAATDNTITLNGTTTGGVSVGDTIYLQDIAAGVWMATGSVIGSGSIATPFSHV